MSRLTLNRDLRSVRSTANLEIKNNKKQLEELERLYTNLVHELKSIKENKKELQTKSEQIQERNVRIFRDYDALIAEYNSRSSDNFLSSNDRIMSTYKQIMDKLNTIQDKTKKIMFDQQREVIKEYNKRFNEKSSQFSRIKEENEYNLGFAQEKEQQLHNIKAETEQSMKAKYNEYEELLEANRNLKFQKYEVEQEVEREKQQLDELKLERYKLWKMIKTPSKAPLELKSTSRTILREPETERSSGLIEVYKEKITKTKEKIMNTRESLTDELNMKQFIKSMIKEQIQHINGKISEHLKAVEQETILVTEEESKKYLEMLLSEERVLTFLSDKAFSSANSLKTFEHQFFTAHTTNIESISKTIYSIERVYDGYETQLKGDAEEFRNVSD